jgi:DNA-binding FrmR family transcriptional regulator
MEMRFVTTRRLKQSATFTNRTLSPITQIRAIKQLFTQIRAIKQLFTQIRAIKQLFTQIRAIKQLFTQIRAIKHLPYLENQLNKFWMCHNIMKKYHTGNSAEQIRIK